ncbi:GbsR/MarR family transcriptional regulator [Haliangium sp.]|uniref:GbsR/MarR family transcriptional regulator n=1 Tax=Haliangium sp. TaxID=2663208 RepID=UPI003D1459DC
MSTHRQDHVVLQVADAIGGLMAFWGFKRNMGRIWTLLYLAPEPLSANEIGERLSLSSGAVSMLLSDLSHWGAVKKAFVRGARRDHYEAETNIWKLVSRVFRERELRKIGEAIEVFEQALRLLETQPAAPDDRGRALMTKRIEGLLSLARTGKTLLQAVLSGESVDASPIRLVTGKRDPPE